MQLIKLNHERALENMKRNFNVIELENFSELLEYHELDDLYDEVLLYVTFEKSYIFYK